jgi:hypothetical protein
VADKTRRWFADSTVPYALAALALFEHARSDKTVHYTFGPLDTTSMLDSGLAVSGPEEDVEAAAAVLAGIPGLAEYIPD